MSPGADHSGNLEETLGYFFHNPDLLDRALRHRPAVSGDFTKNENFMEPLATLGDAVLGAAVAYRIYEVPGSQRGTLTEEMVRKLKHFRNRKFAEKLRLRGHIRRESGDPECGTWAESGRAPETVLNALTGAVFLDAQQAGGNGMTVVRDMLDRLGYF
jgi:dsRNA-specific ribonuclease